MKVDVPACDTAGVSGPIDMTAAVKQNANDTWSFTRNGGSLVFSWFNNQPLSAAPEAFRVH